MHREFGKESGASTSKVKKLIPTCCSNFSPRTRMHDKLDDITTKLQELVVEKNNLGLIVVTNEKHKIDRYEACLVDATGIVGREGDKNALLQKLLGGKDESCIQNFSVVPIVGMGGVGKTTLARLLYDEKEVKDHFEVRAWVCVSDEFSVSNISIVIYESVIGNKEKFADLNLLQLALKEKLKDKLFLIVLDDVWSESYDDWEKLVGQFLGGAPGSRIIITTRKVQLLRKLGYAHVDPLPSLSHEDALSLFARNSLGVDNFDSHPTLKPLGEGFVKKCDGLPLALKALGRLLRTKTDEEEWNDLLDCDIWRLENRDNIVPALRLSYHDLSASLKLLFAYCSLFPKDYVFDKEELTLLWMAEGFLHKSSTSKSMERLGHKYFDDLLSRSFFQLAPNDKSKFVMHDLMNDLATSVAGDFFARLDIDEKESSKNSLKNHRHMSIVCEKYMVLGRFKPIQGAESLRTFLALSVGVVESWQIFYLSTKVLNDLLQKLPMLRVLSLSHLSISEVPEFICSLKHLRYLNLSKTRITHLPENVGNLYHLQTLIVTDCDKLVKLPESFSKLKNLRHFNCWNTPLLMKMPVGISELKSLRTLSEIHIGGENDFAITELKNLQHLHGRVLIKGLSNVQNLIEAREVNLSQNRFSELELYWDSEVNVYQKEVLDELKPNNDALKELVIIDYGGIEFSSWVGDPSFLRLVNVMIHGCKECTSLPVLGQLPSLKELIIGDMSKVKVIGLELLGTGLAFPSLDTLLFDSMSGWEVWTANSGAFPCLRELIITNCPNLVKVSLEALPSLRVLRVTGCGHGVLTSLVNVASLVTELDMDDISGLTDERWKGVIEYLGAVEEVLIERCNEIRYLWGSKAEASKVLLNLRILFVKKCSNLVSIGEKEEDNGESNLKSLTTLNVQHCNNLEHCSCPDNLENLTICSCDLITSVSFPIGGWQILKLLNIQECKKLLVEELGEVENTRVLVTSNMLKLNHICIECLPELRSITALSHLSNLQMLLIEECPNMMSFPDHELPHLTSLTTLKILHCTSMDAIFPRGFWPPKLTYLDIGRLKKPILEWGPQNFPTSLVNLLLYGEPYDDVRNLCQLSHLFPSSLTRLGIDGFEKLESVSLGLQHLTSLQHLLIYNCPKTVDLPEMLLPSLLSLRIAGCPNLKEKSSKGGSYWPIISLIPYFETDEE